MAKKTKNADPKKPASKLPKKSQTCPRTFVVKDNLDGEVTIHACSMEAVDGNLLLRDTGFAVVAIVAKDLWSFAYRVE